MSTLSLAHPAVDDKPNDLAGSQAPTQGGPVYRCFVCGAPARGLAYWPTMARGTSPLDVHAAHIAYLEPTCSCHKAAPGCTRVAVLDGVITPLRFATAADLPDFNDRVGYNVAAVLAALALLVKA